MEFLKTLLSHCVALGILFGGMILLFTNMRFDWATYVFCACIGAFAVFVYWPRSKR